MPNARQIRDTIDAQFVGVIEQVPPMHAAIKVGGKKLYELARKGLTVERASRTVTIHTIDITAYNPPCLTLRIHCGSGTYIRALARDLGEALKTGAYCASLRRAKIGSFDVRDAVDIHEITSDNWEDLTSDR